MGVDIHLNVIKSDGTVILSEDDFPYFRCRAWFDKIMGRCGYDEIYSRLRWADSSDVVIPVEIAQRIKEEGYYGLTVIKISDFINWYNAYKPNIDAGWVTTYDKWLWETKNIYPSDYYKSLDSLGPDINMRDYHFIELPTEDDCSCIIKETLDEKLDEKNDTYLVFYFDC